jgi:predicted nucleic acid-binding protein
MIHAVLDANVFASAVINPAGLPARILAAWREGQSHPVLSEASLNEIGQSPAQFAELLGLIPPPEST